MPNVNEAEPDRAQQDELTPAQLRMLPNCVQARKQDAQRILDAIQATRDGDADALFADHIIALAAGQLEKPVAHSFKADPEQAALIRDAIKNLKRGTVGRWDKEVAAYGNGIKSERRAERKERFGAPSDPDVVEYDKDGKTAIEWAKATTDPDFAEMLSRMNAEHGVVPFSGGAVRYLHRAKDVRGNEDLRFLRPDDFHRLYAHISFNCNGKRLTASQAWERWSRRTQHAGVGMFPGSNAYPPKVPQGYLNLWKGFAVEPKEGDWSKFRNHLYTKVCQGDNAIYEWLIAWLAHTVQKPQEKPGTCVVMKSAAEGTGKSMLSVFLQRIFGDHLCSVSKADQIVGRFNGHLLRNVVLVCEEAFWAGSKDAEGALKNLITESEITIEQKGIDAYSTPNYSRLLMISNNDWVVPVGSDPRRYLVLEVVNKHAQKKAYFDPIWKQMNEGGVEAMLFDLLWADISSSGDLRTAPKTKGLAEQREQSISGVERWLLDVAETGGVRDPATNDRIWFQKNDETLVKTDTVRDAAKNACGPADVRSLDRTLGSLMKKTGVERVRLRAPLRGYSYAFPPAPEFRARVAKTLGVAVDGHDEREGQTIH